MQQKFRDKIYKNFKKLVNDMDPVDVVNFLVNKSVLGKAEADNILHDRRDYKHNNRLILFRVMSMKDKNYLLFLEALEQFNLHHLFSSTSGKVFHRMDQPVNEISSPTVIHENIESTDLSEKRDQPLIVKVKLASNFQQKNQEEVYETRSYKRGRVLIINNHKFNKQKGGENHDDGDRQGSRHDVENLKQLFEQMSLTVLFYEDLLVKEMKTKVENFANLSDWPEYDICMVVIMSHGRKNNNNENLVILDQNHASLEAIWVQDQFNNTNQLLWNKPKIILYQICRGPSLDYGITKRQESLNEKMDMESVLTDSVETDSVGSDSVETLTDAVETDLNITPKAKRRVEDLLIGHACQPGVKAHRCPVKGSWFIQLICKIFMEHSHNTDIYDMLNMVSDELRKYVSREISMQTPSYVNNGFTKKLYFNPGIYQDKEGNLCNY